MSDNTVFDRHRCAVLTLTGELGHLAEAQGARSSTFDQGQPLTSLGGVSASRLCGSKALSVQALKSEATFARLAPPASLPVVASGPAQGAETLIRHRPTADQPEPQRPVARTVFRASFSSRAIAFVFQPWTICASRTLPTVSSVIVHDQSTAQRTLSRSSAPTGGGVTLAVRSPP